MGGRTNNNGWTTDEYIDIPASASAQSVCYGKPLPIVTRRRGDWDFMLPGFERFLMGLDLDGSGFLGFF